MCTAMIEGDLGKHHATDIDIKLDWMDFDRDTLTYDVAYRDRAGKLHRNRCKVTSRGHDADEAVYWINAIAPPAVQRALRPRSPVSLPPRAALLLIDMQQGLDDPRWGARNNPDAEQRIAELLAAWRATGRPVIHVQHLSLEPWSPLREDAPGHAFKIEALPLADEPVFQKHVNSAFIGTDLEARLRLNEIKALVVVGITTDHCVSSTTRMAGNLGFTDG